MLTLWFKFLIGHALADFALQPASMAVGKNRHRQTELSGYPAGHFPPWPYWLSAHALIHGGVVWWITGDPMWGGIEFVFHAFIDIAKCEGWTNIHIDQALHLILKVVYGLIIL